MKSPLEVQDTAGGIPDSPSSGSEWMRAGRPAIHGGARMTGTCRFDRWTYSTGSARGLGFSAADAEDLSQEVLVTFLETPERFEGRCTNGTWLFGILHHKAQARLRLRAQRHYRRARGGLRCAVRCQRILESATGGRRSTRRVARVHRCAAPLFGGAAGRAAHRASATFRRGTLEGVRGERDADAPQVIALY